MNKVAKCPAESGTYFFGGKWKIRILFTLFNKKKVRFGVLKKVLSPVTQQMLSKQLKQLTSDGLINRKVIQIMPPKVEYSLTSFGNSLIPILISLSNWNDKNSKTINLKLNKNFDENRIR
ncbi:MAG: transcriptional regulator [Pelagibacteraceae bacterium]|nr:transcriptional regulator [Pelagibacteraceae bacterium]